MAGERDSINRVSVLVDPQVETWEIAALEKAVDDHDLEITTVVVWDPPADEEISPDSNSQTDETIVSTVWKTVTEFFSLFQRKGPWALVMAARKVYRLLFGFEQVAFTYRDVESVELFADAEFVYSEGIPTRTDTLSTPGMGGTWKRLPDDVVEKVAESSDVTVRFGWGLIEGDILDATEYGVWSFHSSDTTQYRGIASIARYLDDATEAGATLQQLDPSVDGGRVVAFERMDISDLHLQDEIDNRLKRRQIDMLSEGIQKVEEGHEPTKPEDPGELTLAKRKGEWGYCARLLAKEATNAVKKLLGIDRVR